MSRWAQHLAYQLLLWLLAPLALWKGRQQEPSRWLERLGRYQNSPLPENPIWIHAASLGEAKAASMLISELRSAGCAGPFLVTSTTRTGADALTAALKDGDRHLYAPYDLRPVVRSLLRRTRPRLLVVMEVEIWPNIWAEARRQSVSIVLANARLSESSLKRYQRILPALWRDTLGYASLVLAQSELIAGRYRQLGVGSEQIRVSGNLKYSLAIDQAVRARGLQIREQLGASRTIWLAASTHEGEEAIALEIQKRLSREYPTALLVLVPRHPQRFDEAARLCAESGLVYQRRSSDGAVTDDVQVYLADTLGELLALYCMADLAWVAGSFTDVGGHNILEPAACGCPVVVGPDMRNFADILQQFLEVDALIQVSTTEMLADSVRQLLNSGSQRDRLKEQALELAGRFQGTSAEQAKLILQQLPGR